jgi:hypothetical protein
MNKLLKLLGTLLFCAVSLAAQPKNITYPVLTCVGRPGNTAGAFHQQCQDSSNSLYVCGNQPGCSLAAHWNLIGPIQAPGNLLYYMQNSVVASGTYTNTVTGGATTGAQGTTCILTVTGGGGSGATATVTLTGTNAIAGGTALAITAAGTQFTSAPTAATLSTGTATACSGSAVIATVLNIAYSNVSGDFQLLTAPYNPKSTMTVAMPTGAGTITTSMLTFVTPSGAPAVTFIPAGLLACHVHTARTNTFVGTAAVQCLFTEVDSTGNFIGTIGTTEPSANLALTETEYELDLPLGNVYTMASSSSRIAVTVQLVQTSVSVAGNFQFFVGGEADPHILVPTILP